MTTLTSRDGTRLAAAVWEPSGAAAGTVVLVHGYAEHVGRYEHVGRALVARGLRLVGCDLRGHGKSAGARGRVLRFDEYLDDVDAVVATAPPGPRFLLGHSFGGLVATAYLLRNVGMNGAVISSPLYALRRRVRPAQRVLVELLSRLFPARTLPNLVRGKDVSRDPEAQRRYDTDPLVNRVATARWFTEAERVQAEVSRRAGELRLPVLLFHGEADRIADPGRTRELFARLSSEDKTLDLYPEGRHELLNEIGGDRQRVLSRLVDWLAQRAS